MQWSSSRVHGVERGRAQVPSPAESDDTDPALEDPRTRRLRHAAAIGGAIALGVVVGLVVLSIPHGFVRDLTSGLFSGPPPGPALERPLDVDELPTTESARTVLADTERVWGRLLGSYVGPRLSVVETGGVESACGSSSNPGGPFYCPTDHKVYVDVGFLNELGDRFAPQADLAEGYVLAHSVGHHIAAQSGLAGRVENQRAVSDEPARAQLTLREELQADCYAGVWAHHSRLYGHTRPDEIEAAQSAAALLGSERADTGGLVVPETFGHGTATQRSQWFRRGFDSGNLDDCNAFEVLRL
jgi:predicted metalloprotease